MPDLHDFDDFDQGLPAMDLLPAAEIRRRGDRMRRRRTALVAAGGVLAVAVAVGTPVIAFSGGGDDRGVAPVDSPTPSITPDVGDTAWVTSVPGDFPLTAGFPDPDAEPSDALANDPAVPATCASFEGVADSRVVTYEGESEDRAVRYLVLYPDAATAERQLSYFRNAQGSCPADAAGPDFEYASENTEVGTDEAWVLTEQVRLDDDLLSDLTMSLVARTGNAIYVDMSYGSAGGADVVAEQSTRLEQRSVGPLQSMCLFAANPCVIESEAAAPETATGSADIPDGLALDIGFVTDADTEVTGPDANINGVSFADLCETRAWPGDGTTDRLAVRLTGIEYAVTRELVTYDDADAAAAAVAALGDAVAACPESPGTDGDSANDRLFQRLDADTGYESSLTFGFAYREGIGGTLFQVVRVGRGVLATSASGDFLPASLDSGVPGLTDDNRLVTDLMCPFTAAGC